jgi:hypothetical protein
MDFIFDDFYAQSEARLGREPGKLDFCTPCFVIYGRKIGI